MGARWAIKRTKGAKGAKVKAEEENGGSAFFFLGDLCVLERSGRFRKSLVSGRLWTWARIDEAGASSLRGGSRWKREIPWGNLEP